MLFGEALVSLELAHAALRDHIERRYCRKLVDETLGETVSHVLKLFSRRDIVEVEDRDACGHEAAARRCRA